MKRVVLGGTILLVLLTVFQIHYFRKKEKADFLQFYSASIDSEITSLDAGARGVYLTVGNIAYTFKPYTSSLNDKKIFNHIARIGDRVRKEAYADTLYLFRGDKIYPYTFQKNQSALE